MSLDPIYILQLISKPRQAHFLTHEASDLLPRALLQPFRLVESIPRLLVCDMPLPSLLESRVPLVVQQHDMTHSGKHGIARDGYGQPDRAHGPGRSRRESKGFGFIELGTQQEATDAISKMNSSDMDGRTLMVSEALPQTPRESSGSQRGNNGGRGGFRR